MSRPQGRFELHDLLRAFACDQIGDESDEGAIDSPVRRSSARRRVAPRRPSTRTSPGCRCGVARARHQLRDGSGGRRLARRRTGQPRQPRRPRRRPTHRPDGLAHRRRECGATSCRIASIPSGPTSVGPPSRWPPHMTHRTGRPRRIRASEICTADSVTTRTAADHHQQALDFARTAGWERGPGSRSQRTRLDPLVPRPAGRDPGALHGRAGDQPPDRPHQRTGQRTQQRRRGHVRSRPVGGRRRSTNAKRSRCTGPREIRRAQPTRCST